MYCREKFAYFTWNNNITTYSLGFCFTIDEKAIFVLINHIYILTTKLLNNFGIFWPTNSQKKHAANTNVKKYFLKIVWSLTMPYIQSSRPGNCAYQRLIWLISLRFSLFLITIAYALILNTLIFNQNTKLYYQSEGKTIGLWYQIFESVKSPSWLFNRIKRCRIAFTNHI